MEITTLSRKAEDLADAPAAVHVISQADIQRSGARTIPDLLRMVPGMQVAQIDGNKWAVTARGNNGRFANKLLVLMDGRNVYSPGFSGVYWDAQDTDLSAIERIEVVRGPGATMWGANAVNGVVNIITKNAAKTTGGYANLLSGSNDSLEGTLRYGGQRDNLAFRVFAKAFDRGGNSNELGDDTADSWKSARVGTRLDWVFDDGDEIMLSAEAYTSDLGETRISRSLTPPYYSVGDEESPADGRFLTFNWSNNLENGSNVRFSASYSAEERTMITMDLEQETFELDLQQSLLLGSRHNLMWGLAYRHHADDHTTGTEAWLDPADRSWGISSAFIQDDIQISESFRLMLGTKIEYSSIGGSDLEFEPSVRASYRFSEAHTTWASVSRALRLPSRGELDGNILREVIPPGIPENPLPIPTALWVTPGGMFGTEEVIAFEAGYRFRTDTLLLDLAVYYNEYNDQRSGTLGIPTCEPNGGIPALDPSCIATATHVNVPLLLENGTDSGTAGLEIWGWKQLNSWWSLQAAYTYIRETHASDSGYTTRDNVVEDSPEHQLSLRSSMDLGYNMSLDVWLRYVDELEAAGVDAYTALDLRFAWSPLRELEVSAVARNLLADDHVEFISELGDLPPVEIRPEGYIELRWNF